MGVVALMLAVGCSDDNDDESSSATTAPTTSTTLSQIQLDEQKAQRVVLSAADLPGYAQDPPDPDDDSPELDADVNTCLNDNALIKQLGTEPDPRGASGPDFSKGDELTASSDVTFAENEDQARAAITALNAAAFPACLNRALTTELRKDTDLTNVSVTTTKLPNLTAGDQSVGFRSVARARVAGTAVTLNADFTFVRVGRGLAVIDVSSVGTTFPEAERLRLATAVAGRMAAP